MTDLSNYPTAAPLPAPEPDDPFVVRVIYAEYAAPTFWRLPSRAAAEKFARDTVANQIIPGPVVAQLVVSYKPPVVVDLAERLQ